MVGKEWPLQDESQVKMAMKGNKGSPSWSWFRGLWQRLMKVRSNEAWTHEPNREESADYHKRSQRSENTPAVLFTKAVTEKMQEERRA